MTNDATVPVVGHRPFRFRRHGCTFEATSIARLVPRRRSRSGSQIDSELAANSAIALAAPGDDLLGLLETVPAKHFAFLRLQELIGREKRLDLAQPVVAQLGESLDMAEARVTDRDGQHLEIRTLLIMHVEPPEGA